MKNRIVNDVTGPVLVSAYVPEQVSACAPYQNRTPLQFIEKDENTPTEHHAGFIFMCNGRTKPLCFQFRVFGLPIGKKESVEKIQPGAKLFLFDVELKLLYGIYEATSEGKVGWEPTAFGGKYPAQVKFRIFKGSLPLPEQSFRKAIIENYLGNRFSPELSEIQVQRLQSMFRPLAASLSPSVKLPLLDAMSPVAKLPPSREYQYTPQTRYLPRQIYDQQITERQLPARDVQILQHQHHPAALLVGHTNSGAENRNTPAHVEQYYHVYSQPVVQDLRIMQYQQPGLDPPKIPAAFDPYSQQTYTSGGHSWIVQEHYPRYTAAQAAVPYQTTRSESDYHTSVQESALQYQSRLPLSVEGETQLNGQSVTPYYYLPTTQYIPSSMQPYVVYERPEQTVSNPQVLISRETGTISTGGSVASHYHPVAVAASIPSTVATSLSVSADPYIPSTVAPYYPVPSDPYIPSAVAAYHSVQADPYVSSADCIYQPFATTPYY